MHRSLRGAIAALTGGEDAGRQYHLAAERIQQALLDVALPGLEGVDLGSRAEPSRLVGGDYLDIYELDGRLLVFGLGDASGKSLAAALNALMLRYLVRGLIRVLGPEDLASIMRHTNGVTAEDMPDDAFITFLLGVLDTESGALQIVNAGHEPALILPRDSGQVSAMAAHGIVLGIAPDTRYVQQNETLLPGDLALFYTDGLTEATDKKGELYTLERLIEAFIAGRELPAQQLADSIFEAVKTYSNGPLRDDATILIVRKT
jgi:serine phosphatase RsbU (regulator of sigma subunit)